MTGHLDFLADAVVTGRVMGAGPGSPPEQVEDRLGAGYLDDLDEGADVLRRDYGLIELTFVQAPAWVCKLVSIQVHRLARGDPAVVPPVIRSEHGPFPPTVGLAALIKTIRARGRDLEERPAGGDRRYVCYVVAGTTSEIYAVRDRAWPGADRPGADDVWSISL